LKSLFSLKEQILYLELYYSKAFFSAEIVLVKVKFRNGNPAS